MGSGQSKHNPLCPQAGLAVAECARLDALIEKAHGEAEVEHERVMSLRQWDKFSRGFEWPRVKRQGLRQGLNNVWFSVHKKCGREWITICVASADGFRSSCPVDHRDAANHELKIIQETRAIIRDHIATSGLASTVKWLKDFAVVIDEKVMEFSCDCRIISKYQILFK